MARGTWQGSGTWQSSGPDFGDVALIFAVCVVAGVVVEVVLSVIVWIAIGLGILIGAAIVAVVLVWRRTRQREAAYEASPQHQRLIAATVTPQVIQGTPPSAVINNYYIRIDPADRESARIIRQLPGIAGGIISEEKSLCAGPSQKGDAAAPAPTQEVAPRRPTARSGLRSTPASAATAS